MMMFASRPFSASTVDQGNTAWPINIQRPAGLEVNNSNDVNVFARFQRHGCLCLLLQTCLNSRCRCVVYRQYLAATLPPAPSGFYVAESATC